MKILSIYSGHNCTAGISVDGELKFLKSEERFNRKKNCVGFPIETIRYIKRQFLNNNLSNLDKIVIVDETGLGLNYILKEKLIHKKFSKDPWLINKKNYFFNLILNLINLRLLSLFLKIKNQIRFILFKFLFSKKNSLKKIFSLFKDIEFDLTKTYFYNHHDCHALSFAYFFKNFQKKSYLIFTADGEGDNESSCVYRFNKKILKKISTNSKEHSLGYLYMFITEHLGLRGNEHEFKVMGMSSYGKTIHAQRLSGKLKEIFFLDNNGNIKSKIALSLLKHKISEIFSYERFDNICAGIQKFIEEFLIEWIEFWIQKTGLKNVILSGGVFMNIKANMLILKSRNVKSLFVVPSSSDESLPIGALWKANNESSIITKPISNLYLGGGGASEYTIDDFVKKKTITQKFTVTKFSNYKNLNNFVSNLLIKDIIIARCCGREEWGARSLGNRSILCNPSNIENVKKINESIKSRDFWMPFSPTILEGDKNLFIKNLKTYNFKFMTMLADSTSLAKKKLKAAIHPVDSTLRPQLLSMSDNPSYYDLINQFKKKTGIGALLNTSFNLHGEPNVSDYKDAINTVCKSDLNYLILENYLLKKKRTSKN